MIELLNENTNFIFHYDVVKKPDYKDLVFMFRSGKSEMLNSDYSNFGNIVVRGDDIEGYSIPTIKDLNGYLENNNTEIQLFCFGKIADKFCFCLLSSDSIVKMSEIKNLVSKLLKTSYKILPVEQFQAAILAHHIFHWSNTHRFCGICRGHNKMHHYEMVLQCCDCGYKVYPVIAPCVIAVIYKGDEILLAQAAHTVTGAYGCISGYVSPGENLETALKREVMEEVGLEIQNIKYITSQHWPFPNSILMGFVAEYKSGQINIDHKEIADAKWFNKHDKINLPKLPDPISISRHLIDLFL